MIMVNTNAQSQLYCLQIYCFSFLSKYFLNYNFPKLKRKYYYFFNRFLLFVSLHSYTAKPNIKVNCGFIVKHRYLNSHFIVIEILIEKIIS